jgi:hypothetical protein
MMMMETKWKQNDDVGGEVDDEGEMVMMGRNEEAKQ